MGLLNSIGLDAVGSILDKFIPDKEEKLKAEIALRELADREGARQHEEAMGQIETNKIEANHASVFVSGWRPALGWIGSAGFAVAFIVHPLMGAVEALMERKAIPEYPVDNLVVLITYLLGASGIRSFDKLKGISFSSLGSDPGAAKTKAVSGSATPALAQKLPVTTSGSEGTPHGDESTQAEEVPSWMK